MSADAPRRLKELSRSPEIAVLPLSKMQLKHFVPDSKIAALERSVMPALFHFPQIKSLQPGKAASSLPMTNPSFIGYANGRIKADPSAAPAAPRFLIQSVSILS